MMATLWGRRQWVYRAVTTDQCRVVRGDHCTHTAVKARLDMAVKGNRVVMAGPARRTAVDTEGRQAVDTVGRQAVDTVDRTDTAVRWEPEASEAETLAKVSDLPVTA